MFKFFIDSKKSLVHDGFNGEFYQTFKELTPTLLKPFQKTKEEGILPNSFYEASIPLITKLDKNNTGKENYGEVNSTVKDKDHTP